MKASRSFLLAVLLLVVVITAMVGVRAVRALPTTDRAWRNVIEDFYKGVTIGPVAKPGAIITASYFWCDSVIDTSGNWASRSTSTSSSESFSQILTNPANVGVPAKGDTCIPVLGPIVSAAKQALNYQCEISSNGTATLHATNASGGTIVPTIGKRCVRTFSN